MLLDQALYGEAGVPGVDTILGGDGNDRIWGDDRDDPRLDGGPSNAKLYGNAEDDVLHGDAGDAGDDRMTGDRVAGNEGANDVCRGACGRDRQADGEVGSGIPWSGRSPRPTAVAAVDAADPAAFIGRAAVSAARVGQAREARRVGRPPRRARAPRWGATTTAPRDEQSASESDSLPAGY